MVSPATRRGASVAVPLLALLAAVACGGPQPAANQQPDRKPPAAPAGALPSPTPSADAPCPYLKDDFISDANGQRVAKVRTSADRPYPACFFYSAGGGVQITTRVYLGDPGTAKALVDQAAPVATSNPANLEGGWQGGSQPTDTGAVYAVAKGRTAVVVTTNQKQTVKARRVTEQVIATLRL